MTAQTTTTTTRQLTMAAAENEALDIAMAADERVVLLGEDIADPAGGVFKVTKGLSTKYGTHRVRATPIAEHSIVGTSVGLSLGGFRPVAEIMFLDFLTLALDPLVNHAAKLRYMSGGRASCPLTVRTAVGTSRFGAQHSQSLEAWLMHIPGLNVVMPATPADAKGLLLSCIASDDPCVFIESVSLLFAGKGEVPEGDVRIEIGKADVKRAGDDVTIITYGTQLRPSIEAAEAMAAEGRSVEVVDLRSLLPLDRTTILASVRKTRRAVVVHSATQFCGPGAEIAATINEALHGELLAPVVRVGGEFLPRPFAQNLTVEPTVDAIVAAVRGVLA